MIIRKAKLSDSKEFVKLFKLFRKDDDAIFARGVIKEAVTLKKGYEEEVEKDFIKIVLSPKKIIYFAEENNKIIGVAWGSISEHSKYFKYHDKEGFVEGIFVIKGKRGKGVSTALRNELFSWFKSKKLRFVGLSVYDKNKKAQKIYKKWGFKPFWNKMELKL